MNSKIILCAALVSSAALFGCSKEVTSSNNIKTPGIAALIDVTAENESLATVHVELRVGGSSSNTYVILESGDRLSATAGETTKEMSAEAEGEYEAEFQKTEAETPTAANTKFSVAFERADGDNALDNSGTMPAPFGIGELPTTKPSRATDEFNITWSPVDTGSQMVAELSGTCIFNKTIDVVGDDGTLVIPKGTLESTGGDMPKECEISVELRRTRVGKADAVFDQESWFKLHQVRRASFVSAP